MDLGATLDDAFAYAKESVWGRTHKWLVLIGCLIIFPLILGYMVRIFRGATPAPEPEQWGIMFIDGLKLLIVEIIYAAPVILLIMLAFIPLLFTMFASGPFATNYDSMTDTQFDQWLASHPEFFTAIGIMIVLLLLAVLVGFLITIFSFLGTVRFARSGSIAEAFNFSAILSHIRRIGWFNYLLALIVIGVIGFIFGMIPNVFSLIPVIGDIVGLIIMIVLYVPFLVFSSRFAALVYDAGEEKGSTGTLQEGVYNYLT